MLDAGNIALHSTSGTHSEELCMWACIRARAYIGLLSLCLGRDNSRLAEQDRLCRYIGQNVIMNAPRPDLRLSIFR